MATDSRPHAARRVALAADSVGGDDETVAQRAGTGDVAAFEVLVRRYGAAVLAVVERRVGGDPHRAADLAQDAWVKVHKGLPKYRSTGAFRSWLFAVVLNQVRDGLKAEARRPTVPLADDFEASVPSDEHGHDEKSAVRAALTRVDEPYRTAVALVDLAGLSYDEAGTSLGCSTGTVKSRVHRGRLAFRDAYLQLTTLSPATRRSPRVAHGALP